MKITKGDTSLIFTGANFTKDEIYKGHFGDVGNSFDFSEKTLYGAQAIRDYFGESLGVNASYRTREHDISQGRSGNGAHPRGLAIDLDPSGETASNIILLYHQEILTKGELYHQLRKLGITGIGLYDGFIHIDSRPEGGKQTDQYGTYAFWDNRVTTKKKFPALKK